MRKNLQVVVDRIAEKSKRTWSFRGKREISDTVDHVWTRLKTSNGSIVYEINRDHPIVTYSLALFHRLIKKQFKNYDLDLQNIWLRQSVPAVVSTALEVISEKVFLKITDPSRQTINVTQWCKREDCWKSVQAIEVALSSDLQSVLIGAAEEKLASRDAKADQKLISGAEAQAKVLEYSAEQWKALSKFAMQKTISPDELTALKYACQIPAKIPSPYQSQRLLALLDRAESDGFKI